MVFMRSRSTSFQAALALASSAGKVLQVGDGVAHVAVFTPDASALAVALLSLVGQKAGTLVFVRGRPVGSAWGAVANVERVLRCYLTASACLDHRAACHAVSTSLFSDGSTHPPAVFPCRHILRLMPAPLERLAPVTEPVQIDHLGQAYLHGLCPLFDPMAFRYIPTLPPR